MVKVRLHGTPEECQAAARRMSAVFPILAISLPYPDRGESLYVRVYLEVELLPRSAPAHARPAPGPATEPHSDQSIPAHAPALHPALPPHRSPVPARLRPDRGGL